MDMCWNGKGTTGSMDTSFRIVWLHTNIFGASDETIS
jgi:hypothetical protein